MKTAKDAPKGLTPEQAESWAHGWNTAGKSCPNPQCRGPVQTPESVVE